MAELNDLDQTIRRRALSSLKSSGGSGDGGGAKASKVIPVLDLLESLEKHIRPPETSKAEKVVILGKTFIMKRDFEIWDYTFSAMDFNVAKTNKQDLAQHQHDDWVIMKCLDLFDGKSHCIEPNDLPSLARYQRVSRLYGLRKTLWNKDRFCDTMSSALKGFDQSGHMEFVFPCWLLPGSFEDLMREARTKYKGMSFIAKPTDRGEGNGINVIDNYKKLARWKDLYPENDEIVVQTYLPNPMLIKQRKWDMRTYVLVTSIHPLRVYMYRDGLVRFASSKYDADAKDGGKKTSYLTNTSVNKKSGIDVDELTWPFPKVYAHMKKIGLDPDLLWARIEKAVVQVLISSEPAFVRGFKKLQNDYTCVNCYQLLGVDVIVDDKQVPRVIEMNGEPSMQLSGEKGSHYDHTKKSMAHDLVALLFNRDSFARALAADLTELELSGFSIGYATLGSCTSTVDACLSNTDIEYLLEWKKEQQNMGGFRRIYPSKVGDYYTDFLAHVETKMPYGTATSTNKIHKIVTALEKQSRWITNNDIEDKLYNEFAVEEEAD